MNIPTILEIIPVIVNAKYHTKHYIWVIFVKPCNNPKIGIIIISVLRRI